MFAPPKSLGIPSFHLGRHLFFPPPSLARLFLFAEPTALPRPCPRPATAAAARTRTATGQTYVSSVLRPLAYPSFRLLETFTCFRYSLQYHVGPYPLRNIFVIYTILRVLYLKDKF